MANYLKYLYCIDILCMVYANSQYCSESGAKNHCFRAAVYEHVQQDAEMGRAIELNLDVFDAVTREASINNADIIVFPENGILSQLIPRKKLRPFLEEIPNTMDSKIHNPCKQSESYRKSHPILYRLSCMASNNNIYVVADMGEIQHCDNTSNKCPSDGFYQFNTAVIFDNAGNLLAKYEKIHLFLEPYYDIPPNPRMVSIDTHFGRLGTQICFDIIYKIPGIHLAEQMNVSTILFPTWWFDELPFLTASQYHQAWAITNQVNLLSANIQKPEVGSMGSGIYSGESGAIIHTNKHDGKSKLLIANIPITSTSTIKCSPNEKLIVFDFQPNINTNYFYLNMSLDNTKQIILNKNNDSIHECHNGLCCQLNYTLNNFNHRSGNQNYYLIVSNRTRAGSYPWAEEFCGIVRCESDYTLKCNSFTNSFTETSFGKIEMRAKFSTKYIYPNVMSYDNKLIDRNDWDFQINNNESVLVVQNFNQCLTSFGLYARVYERDPSYIKAK